MKKTIDNKFYSVTYTGEIDELKLQLGYLAENWTPSMNDMIQEDIKNLENIPFSQNKEFSDMNFRIYYGKEKLTYRMNSSSEQFQKSFFPMIREKCDEVDKQFLKNNPAYNIEVKNK